jgi:hypothetical protein
VRLTPVSSHSSRSISRCPGRNRRLRIAWRMLRRTWLRTGAAVGATKRALFSMLVDLDQSIGAAGRVGAGEASLTVPILIDKISVIRY